jgi:NAD(P)-dependent dehydrogenase (short-subunit alcohol dehydrogenase family)
MTSIFITGIARGIGHELARQSLVKGWQVAGSVRTDNDKQYVERELPGTTVLLFDVCDHEAIDKAAASFGRSVDILINNSGVIGPDRQSTLDMDFDGFALTLATNTIAPLKISQAFLPNMRRAGNSKLVTISSNMGRMPHTASDRIAYRASKSAVNKIVQGLATDLKEDGICVIAMHPGWVRSDMGGQSASISVEESAAGILNVVSGLTMADTCQFIDWDGTLQVW